MADFFTIEQEWQDIFPGRAISKKLDDSCVSKIEFEKDQSGLFRDYCFVEYSAVIMSVDEKEPRRVKINPHRLIADSVKIIEVLSQVKDFQKNEVLNDQPNSPENPPSS